MHSAVRRIEWVVAISQSVQCVLGCWRTPLGGSFLRAACRLALGPLLSNLFCLNRPFLLMQIFSHQHGSGATDCWFPEAISLLRYGLPTPSSALLSGCPSQTPLDFPHFKRRKRGNLQVGGTERLGVPAYRGLAPRPVKNSPTPATGGVAPGRWRPRRSATACRTRPLGAGSWGAVFATRERPGRSREEPQQDGRGAGDGQIGPLALGLHAQVGTHLLKEPAPYLIRGDLQLPAQDKPFQDLGRVRRWVGAQQGLGGEGALGIADQHPANEDGRLAGAVPDCRLRREFHRAGGAVMGTIQPWYPGRTYS